MRLRDPWRALLGLALLLVALFATRAASATPDADVDADVIDSGAAELVLAEASARAPAPPAHVASAAPTPSATAATAAIAASAPTPSVSAAPSAAAATVTPEGGAAVRLRDRRVFVVRVARGGVPAIERARRASQVLERVFDEKVETDVRVEEQQGLAVVFAGSAPIVQLGPEDAEAAGDATVMLHGAAVAGQIRNALRTESTRASVANTVFAVSLLVFSGLVAFLALRRLGDMADRMRRWIEEEPERLPTLRVGSLEVLRPAAFQGAIAVAVGIGKRVLQIVLLYAWTVFALSLFEPTRGYGERVSGFVVTPLSALLVRLGSGLPLAVVFAAAAVAVAVLFRFVGLLFGSVARGETTFEWLPRDLARPVSAIIRIGLVIVALLLAAPLVTGSDEGALARTGTAVLVALALASVPILATLAVGVVFVFGRRFRVGDFLEIGERTGRLRVATLLEVRMEDRDGCEVRVPHLVSLMRTTRVIGSRLPVSLEVTVHAATEVARAREVLLEVAKRVGRAARVDLLQLNADGARFRVVAAPATGGEELATAVSEALKTEQIALGGRGIELRP